MRVGGWLAVAAVAALIWVALGSRRGNRGKAVTADGIICLQCGRPGDEHTGLCGECLISLEPYFRHKAERFAITAALVKQAMIDEAPMGAPRWTEQQYRDYLRRAQAPAPKEERKSSGGGRAPKHDPCALVLELPLIPSANGFLRMHFRARKRLMEQLAATMMEQLPLGSGIPFRRASVEVVRQSSAEPDPDGLYGFVKPILDAMQVRGQRHPYGAGIIANDSHDAIDLKVRWEKAPPKKGKVIVVITPK